MFNDLSRGGIIKRIVIFVGRKMHPMGMVCNKVV